MNLKNQTFYKFVSKDNEVTIGYCYKNPDANNELGIGFNIADGGGWIPILDITKGTKITEVEFSQPKPFKHKLYNKDISEQYRDMEFHLMKSDFLGSFASWITRLNPNIEMLSNEPIKAYNNYLKQRYFKTKDSVKKFTYSELNEFITEDIFIAIPEIMALNEMKPDFISLGALSRNMFYSICRDHITQPL